MSWLPSATSSRFAVASEHERSTRSAGPRRKGLAAVHGYVGGRAGALPTPLDWMCATFATMIV
jgi:hypothetical protein